MCSPSTHQADHRVGSIKQIYQATEEKQLVRGNHGVQSQSFSKYYVDGSGLKVHIKTQLMLVTEYKRNACKEAKTAHLSTPFDNLLLNSLAYFKQNATSENKKPGKQAAD